jgi:hypothetical protein
VRNGGNYDTLAALGSGTDHAIEVALWNGRHGTLYLELCALYYVLILLGSKHKVPSTKHPAHLFSCCKLLCDVKSPTN